MKKFTVRGKEFVDEQGCPVLLKGINMVCKESDRGYIGNYTDEDFAWLASMGMNVIRLGIFWNACEPEPGKYNDTYLDQVAAIVGRAKAHGIAVYLDMHQDLYNWQWSDGAPDWATLTDGQPHIATELWSESYLVSPAVQHAFDNFWNNTPCADGIGLQDRFLALWKHIAQRFRDESAVIGYDVFNEPFPGSEAEAVVGTMCYVISEGLKAAGQDAGPEEVMEMWMDDEKKVALLGAFSDKEQYRRLVHSLAEASSHFDGQLLSLFYQRMCDTIRSVDPEALLFIEANYFCNTGVPSGVVPPVGSNGCQDPYLVYSPHGYDLMVDTDFYTSEDYSRLEVIFETHAAYAEKWNLPVLAGEWGCYPNASEAQCNEARFILELFRKLGFSQTYFDFSHIRGNAISKVF